MVAFKGLGARNLINTLPFQRRMALKCDICKAKLEQTFLEKVIGTYVKDAKGKKHLACPQCQKKFPRKAELLKQL